MTFTQREIEEAHRRERLEELTRLAHQNLIDDMLSALREDMFRKLPAPAWGNPDMIALKVVSDIIVFNDDVLRLAIEMIRDLALGHIPAKERAEALLLAIATNYADEHVDAVVEGEDV